MRNESRMLILQLHFKVFSLSIFFPHCMKTSLKVEENITESIYYVSRHNKNIGNTLIAEMQNESQSNQRTITILN